VSFCSKTLRHFTLLEHYTENLRMSLPNDIYFHMLVHKIMCNKSEITVAFEMRMPGIMTSLLEQETPEPLKAHQLN